MSRRQKGLKQGLFAGQSPASSLIVALFLITASILFTALAVAFVSRNWLDNSPPLASETASLITPAAADLNQVTPNALPVDSSQPDQDRTWLISAATPNPLPTKQIEAPGGQPRAAWTATPVPTNTPLPSPTPNPTFVSSAYGLGDYMPPDISPGERWIDVNVTEQKLVAFEGLIPVFETLVSTGTASHPTVTGQFRIWLRFQSQDMNGYRLGYDYYLKGVPYVQYFFEDYALHGTFWHSNFGRPMSHGCVNLSPESAEWLYNWGGYGTLVNIHP